MRNKVIHSNKSYLIYFLFIFIKNMKLLMKSIKTELLSINLVKFIWTYLKYDLIKAQVDLEFQSKWRGVCWRCHKHFMIRDIEAFRASQRHSSWKAQWPKDFFHYLLSYHLLTKWCTNIPNWLQLSLHRHTSTS